MDTINLPLIVVCVRPQLAENIGMVARAMMNCGVRTLRLVQPKANHLAQEALAASCGADEILQSARVYNSLQEAIADTQFVCATTARLRDMVKPVMTAEQAAVALVEKEQGGQKCALLFGCERTGLENDELACADMLLTVPLNPQHTSLNLAQSVLLVCYEYLKASNKASLSAKITPPASKQELTAFLHHLDEVLEAQNYYRVYTKKPRMKRNLENIFIRAELTSQEIRTLYGVLQALLDKKDLHFD